jgi:hypothetical protein
MEADTQSVNDDTSDGEVPGINAPEINAIGNIEYNNNELTSKEEEEQEQEQ